MSSPNLLMNKYIGRDDRLSVCGQDSMLISIQIVIFSLSVSHSLDFTFPLD